MTARPVTHDFNWELAVRHSERFRRVSNRYPRRVTEAYNGDVTAAAAASDDEVARRVADWERASGLEVRDWYAIGRDEQRGDDR